MNLNKMGDIYSSRADDSESSRKGFFQDSISGISIKVLATGIGFLASLIYARALGAEQYGYYALITAWMLMLHLACSMGLGEYLVREVAKSATLPHSRWLFRWAQKRVLIAFLVVLPILAVIQRLFPLNDTYLSLVYIALGIPIINTFNDIPLAVLRGRGKVVLAQALQFLFSPMLMLIFLLFAWWVLGELTAYIVLATMLLSGLCTAALSHITYYKLKGEKGRAPWNASVWSSFPFLLLSSLAFLNTRLDQIVIGALMDPQSVGVYSLGARVAQVITFVSLGFEIALGPRIARLFSLQNKDEAQHLIQNTARWVFSLALLAGIPVLYFSDTLLNLAFGKEFVPGAAVLTILIVAHIARFAFGPCALVLNMADSATTTMRVLTLGFVVNLCLNLLLIPEFGIEGAAIATGVSYMFSAITLNVCIRRKMTIAAGII